MTHPPVPVAAVEISTLSAPPSGPTVLQKNVAVALLVLAALSTVLHLTIFRTWLPAALQGGSDFRSFYAAGIIVNQGLRRQVYDQKLQDRIQKQIVPTVVGDQGGLYYFHPPLELPFYALLARSPYRTAYTIAMAVNLVILVAVASLLLRSFPILKQLFGPLLIIILLGFWPVFAAGDIRAGRMFRAGCLLGLTVFKFQYVVPLAALALLTGRRRLFAGVSASAALCGLASLIAVGWRGLWMELGMMLQLNQGVAGTAAQVQNKIYPTMMLNLRGLLYLALSAFTPEHLIMWLVGLTSLVLFSWVATRIRTMDESTWFALATLTAIAVSYHCYGHDGVLYLLPVAVLLQTRYRYSTWPLLAILPFVVPALGLIVLRHRETLLALPALALLVVSVASSAGNRVVGFARAASV